MGDGPNLRDLEVGQPLCRTPSEGPLAEQLLLEALEVADRGAGLLELDELFVHGGEAPGEDLGDLEKDLEGGRVATVEALAQGGTGQDEGQGLFPGAHRGGAAVAGEGFHFADDGRGLQHRELALAAVLVMTKDLERSGEHEVEVRALAAGFDEGRAGLEVFLAAGGEEGGEVVFGEVPEEWKAAVVHGRLRGSSEG